MSIHNETFDEFYARLSANRKAAIAACTDEVKREELVAWDKHYEDVWRASWNCALQNSRGSQSSVTEDEQWERDQQYRSENASGHHRSDYEEHSTYGVSNGRVW